MELTEIKEQLTKANLKVTHQRLVVYSALLKLENHPSAEQVYEFVKPDNPSISLATVYKTLETFVQKGLLNKVSSPEGQMRYDPRLKDHNHIYCLNTKEIIDYFDEDLNNLILDFLKSKHLNNLRIKNISLHIKGDKIDPSKEVSIN
ncbi:MAG: transcriptional repressor [Bacteroidota bacterium]